MEHRYRPVLAAAAAVLAVAAVTSAMRLTRTHSHAAPAVSRSTAAGQAPVAAPARSSVTATPTPTVSTPSPAPRPRTASAATTSRATISRLVRKAAPGSISLAVQDTVTGARYTAGASSGMWTASVYKLFVLQTLLLESQHASGDPLSDDLALAAKMIENSDNEAGYDLFLQAGGNAALSATLHRLGMTHTVPGNADPTFTTTSAADCLRALQALIRNGPLDAASRKAALHLMADVEADQRWGVSAAADPRTSFVNKNGWLAVDNSNGSGDDDNGRWIVTSLGIVTVHGHRTLLAVLTQHQPSRDAGEALIAKLAKLAVGAV